MSSVNAQYAQRITKSFVVHVSATDMFTEEDIANFVKDNRPFVKKLGSTYVVSETSNDFKDLIEDGATGLTASNATGDENTIVKDMGKEVRFGTSSESSLIVMRLVQLVGPSLSNGTADAYNGDALGYVVVENNTSDVTGFDVGVARV